MNTEHLCVLHELLCREKERLSLAKSDSAIEIRSALVSQLEREVAREMEFLGLNAELTDIDDDELLSELSA